MQGRTRWAAFAALVVMAGAAAACGNSNSTSTTTTTAATTTTKAGSSTTGSSTSGSSTTGASGSSTTTSSSGAGTTTSGAPKKATGTPIVVGYTNVEGGAISVPEWRIGWEQGVSYVNNVLGGVNGHPIQTMLCTVDGSPEKSVDCGNKFVEAKVPIVFQGVDFAGGAMLPILKDAGIPVGGHIAWDAQERAALDQARYFGSASPAYGAAQLKNMSQNGAKKVRFFLADVPASHVYDETVLQPTAQKLGLDEKMIYYDAASVDWNVVVQTALADGPDAIGSPAAQEADCVGFVKAARAAAFKNPIYPAACTGYIKALGADSVGTRTYGDLWLVTDPAEAPAAKQAEIKAYTDTMKAAGQDDKVEGLAVAGFSDAVTFQRVFGSLSTFDSKTLKDTLFSAKVDSFMGQQIVCDGTAWKGETNCGNKVLFYEVKDGGDRKLLGTGPVDVAEFQPK